MNRWVNVEDGTPKNDEPVMVDWTDGKTGNKYLGYATFDKELGWKLNSLNNGNYTINRWRNINGKEIYHRA